MLLEFDTSQIQIFFRVASPIEPKVYFLSKGEAQSVNQSYIHCLIAVL